MPPNVTTVPADVRDHEDDLLPVEVSSAERKHQPVKKQFVWRNIILFAYLHMAALYGIWLIFTSAQMKTTLFCLFMYLFGGLGITAGVHRLWAHKSFKAKWPLRLFLAIANTLAFQDAVVDWARDHRMHHKYSETDADPHNAKRGFFFSHVGWLLLRKHPDIKKKGHNVDMSDLYADPILRFQKKYYQLLMPLICFILPVVIPMYFFGETFGNANFLNLFRYTLTLNATWMVNSVAHFFGEKPYDRFIYPGQSLVVAFFALGEGWHNYHHVFPWDYKTSELGRYSTNPTAAFIDFMAKIGQAYDLKSVSQEMVKARVLRTGDGSHDLWGWGDKDQTKEDTDMTLITHRKQS